MYSRFEIEQKILDAVSDAKRVIKRSPTASISVAVLALAVIAIVVAS
jgi:hypothetical protein